MRQIATDDYGFRRLITGGCANVSHGLGDTSNAGARRRLWNIRWNDIPSKEQDDYIARMETVGAGL